MTVAACAADKATSKKVAFNNVDSCNCRLNLKYWLV